MVSRSSIDIRNDGPGELVLPSLPVRLMRFLRCHRFPGRLFFTMAKTQHTYLDAEFWSDSDYRTPQEKLLALYVFAHMDAAGVTTFDLDHIKGCTKIGKRLAREIVTSWVTAGKAEWSDDGGYLWWKSGIRFRLFKGNYSETQLKAVQTALISWENRGIFGGSFAAKVVTHYERKYLMKIPLPAYLNSPQLN